MSRIIHASLLLFVSLGLAFGADGLSAGAIVGRITYDDRVPKVSGDRGRCARVGSVRTAVLVRVLNPPPGGKPGAPLQVEIRDCQFDRRVIGLMTGQQLVFKNSDDISHNVHGLPKVNRGFNIGMPPTLRKSVSFNKPEPLFKVKCDVHPWMNSYVAVMTHPYFAVTDAEGRFKIENLPDGTYEVEALDEHQGTQSFEVEIKGGAAEPVSRRF